MLDVALRSIPNEGDCGCNGLWAEVDHKACVSMVNEACLALIAS